MASKDARQRLERRIAEGEWEPGASLPSAEQLARELEVSRVTVQKALAELAGDGLIRTHPGRRAVLTDAPVPSPRVDSGGRAAAPAPVEISVDALDRHLGRALRGPGRSFHVDALCVTAESFVTALQLQIVGLRTRQDRVLDDFRVRLLICDFSATPTFPRVSGDPDDQRPLDRLRRIAHDQISTLRSAADSLHTYQLVATKPVIEVKTVPFPAMAKLYLVNDDEVLEGWYQLTNRQVDIGGHQVLLDDVAGLSTRLFARRRHQLPNHVDSVYVDAAREFFDSWWAKATPYAIGVTLGKRPSTTERE